MKKKTVKKDSWQNHKKTKILKMSSVFQPLISEYIGGRLWHSSTRLFENNTNNFEDFQGLLHLYCFEWL